MELFLSVVQRGFKGSMFRREDVNVGFGDEILCCGIVGNIAMDVAIFGSSSFWADD